MPGEPGDELADDASIPDQTRALRRIASWQIKTSDDTDRPQSDAFSNSTDGTGTSVNIWEEGEDPNDSLRGHDEFGLVYITVGDIRAAGLGIVRDRIHGNPNHALIQGKKTKSAQRKLAKAAQWIKRPDPLS